MRTKSTSTWLLGMRARNTLKVRVLGSDHYRLGMIEHRIDLLDHQPRDGGMRLRMQSRLAPTKLAMRTFLS